VNGLNVWSHINFPPPKQEVRKETSGERVERQFFGTKEERTLAQGLVALNQLTHTNCFWIFFGLWDRP
jgi:hypothetical protein